MARWVRRQIRWDPWWQRVATIVHIMEPVMQLLRRMDPGGQFMSLVLEWAQDLVQRVKEACAPLGSSIADRIIKRVQVRSQDMLEPAHCAGFLLSPRRRHVRYFSGEVQEYHAWLVRQAKRYILTHTGFDLEGAEYLQACRQFEDFHMQQGRFGDWGGAEGRARGRACSGDTETIECASWWSQYGARAPELQRRALRVMHMWFCASPAERNWAVHEGIHTKKRNRLAFEKVVQLVEITANVRLTEYRRAGCGYVLPWQRDKGMLDCQAGLEVEPVRMGTRQGMTAAEIAEQVALITRDPFGSSAPSSADVVFDRRACIFRPYPRDDDSDEAPPLDGVDDPALPIPSEIDETHEEANDAEVRTYTARRAADRAEEEMQGGDEDLWGPFGEVASTGDARADRGGASHANTSQAETEELASSLPSQGVLQRSTVVRQLRLRSPSPGVLQEEGDVAAAAEEAPAVSTTREEVPAQATTEEEVAVARPQEAVPMDHDSADTDEQLVRRFVTKEVDPVVGGLTPGAAMELGISAPIGGAGSEMGTHFDFDLSMGPPPTCGGAISTDRAPSRNDAADATESPDTARDIMERERARLMASRNPRAQAFAQALEEAKRRGTRGDGVQGGVVAGEDVIEGVAAEANDEAIQGGPEAVDKRRMRLCRLEHPAWHAIPSVPWSLASPVWSGSTSTGGRTAGDVPGVSGGVQETAPHTGDMPPPPPRPPVGDPSSSPTGRGSRSLQTHGRSRIRDTTAVLRDVCDTSIFGRTNIDLDSTRRVTEHTARLHSGLGGVGARTTAAREVPASGCEPQRGRGRGVSTDTLEHALRAATRAVQEQTSRKRGVPSRPRPVAAEGGAALGESSGAEGLGMPPGSRREQTVAEASARVVLLRKGGSPVTIKVDDP
ncbi:hypothetical protein CBR_g39839 [Chara braunii]|uniref:HAT C-terminal dimerisation domain-containing protein n=1 Tax=Chara braunii TaxID=69332 RepID=A0A388LSN6_CHABU|nr:hypothetical protein CBR_g39839 [Chara braunii]|eukprot:GBG85271.1 hypothetical protein CBR_g39839 [Chara braunii]